MAIISAANLNGILDNCNGYYLEILGSSGSGFGYSDATAAWGAGLKAANIATIVSGISDLTQVASFANPTYNLQQLSQALVAAGQDISQLLFAVQQNIIQYSPNSSVRNLDGYLTYLNTTSPYWQALQYPTWGALGSTWFAGAAPSPWNVYNTTYSTSGAPLGTLVVGTGFTAGGTIDYTKYAGAFPKIIVAGFTGSSGTVTVAGNARDPLNVSTPALAVTWTATGVAANGTFTLVAQTAPANSLILEVTNITVSGSITGGTVYAVGVAPAGRPSEP